MASFSALPMELLLKTVEHEEQSLDRQRLFAEVRGTCGELHGKTLHYFGAKHLAQIRVSLTEKDVLHLRATSQSAIDFHLRDLVIDVDALFELVTYSFSTQINNRKGSTSHPMYSASVPTTRDTRTHDCILNESVADFVEAPSCKQALGAALAGFSRLSSIRIRGPMNMLNVVPEDKTREIERRWVVAAGVLFSTVLSHAATLRTFIADDEAMRLHMRSYAFEKIASHSSNWTSPLQQLHMYLANDPDRGIIHIPSRSSAYHANSNHYQYLIHYILTWQQQYSASCPVWPTYTWPCQ